MLIVCPACGKKATFDLAGDGETLEAHTCERCGCDLSALRDIRLAASLNLRRAKSALEQRAWNQALGFATRSWTMVRDEASVAIACLAAAALGDAATIEQWRRRQENLCSTHRPERSVHRSLLAAPSRDAPIPRTDSTEVNLGADDSTPPRR